jgi:exodeoxyribonuclease VII large subunit
VTARLHNNQHDKPYEYRLQAALSACLQRLTPHSAAAHRLSPIQLRSVIAAARTRFDSLINSRDNAINIRMEACRQHLSVAAAALDAMSPLRVLERGYAIAQDRSGQVVREAKTIRRGDEIRVRLWKGALNCRVEDTENESR